MTKTEIFALITATRKAKGISQLKLSELINVKESTLIRNLKDESEMRLSTLIKICIVLEIKIIIEKI